MSKVREVVAKCTWVVMHYRHGVVIIIIILNAYCSCNYIRPCISIYCKCDFSRVCIINAVISEWAAWAQLSRGRGLNTSKVSTKGF